MKFVKILYLLNSILFIECSGTFKISHFSSENQNGMTKIRYKHTLLCTIECLKVEDCNMVQISDKRCDILINCPSPSSNNNESHGVFLENFARKHVTDFAGKLKCQKCQKSNN